MARHWQDQRERGSRFMLRLLLACTRIFGRTLTRLVLWPIVAYFLLTGGASRRASREYLQRVLGREPSWRDTARQFHAFASVSLDRFFLLSGGTGQFDVRTHMPPDVEALTLARRGCLLLLAHVGGFEAMRLASVRYDLPLRVLMDLDIGRKLMSLFEQLNPQLASQVIDASERGPALVLKLKEALQQGAIVGTMADRAAAGERALTVDFLGGRARLPAGPWVLAASLGVPVIIAFGLYRGGNRYDLHYEMFEQRVTLPRAAREQALQQCVQRYAARLEHYVRLAPYNWFNFYDYWAADA